MYANVSSNTFFAGFVGWWWRMAVRGGGVRA